MSKKAVVSILTFSISIVLIVAALFFLFYYVLDNFPELSQTVINDAEEAKCLSIINLKSSIGSFSETISDYIFMINKGCLKEQIVISDPEHEIIFEQLADRQASCWRRYGEGNIDFLGDFSTTGSWCFTCSRVDFIRDARGQVIPYDDFIAWVAENEDRYGLMDNVAQQGLRSSEVEELVEEADQARREIISQGDISSDPDAIRDYEVLNTVYYNLIEASQKRINTNEAMFVVYRYERPVDSAWENLGDRFSSTGPRIGKFFGSGLGLNAAFRGEYNDDYIQYVDLMTQAQYYRSCGIEPRIGRE